MYGVVVALAAAAAAENSELDHLRSTVSQLKSQLHDILEGQVVETKHEFTHHVVEDGPLAGEIITKLNGEYVHPDHPILLEMAVTGLPKNCKTAADKQKWEDDACRIPTKKDASCEAKKADDPTTVCWNDCIPIDKGNGAKENPCLHMSGRAGRDACKYFCTMKDMKDADVKSACKMAGKGPVGKCACNNAALHAHVCEVCPYNTEDDSLKHILSEKCKKTVAIQQRSESSRVATLSKKVVNIKDAVLKMTEKQHEQGAKIRDAREKLGEVESMLKQLEA